MDDEIRNRLKALRDKLAPVPGFPHVLASGADVAELIDCLVAMNPRPKITITNNSSVEDRNANYGSEAADKFVEGMLGLPRIAEGIADQISDISAGLAGLQADRPNVVNNLAVVRRPWWKFWGK